ncbi:MAG: Phosphopantetheine attachment site [Pseudomonadota bacterium]|jgi:acyl carrier protein
MNDNTQTIKTVIATKLRVPADFLSDDFKLDELGLDSLSSAEVVLGVEKHFGVRLDLTQSEQPFTRDTTLREFVALLVGLLERTRCGQ